MFGTLKAGKKNNAGSMVFVEDNRPNRGTSGSPHIACKSCREKKLKCTGEPAGCKRCKSVNGTCEYPSPTEDKRGNRSRRATQSSTPSREPSISTGNLAHQSGPEFQHPSLQSSMPGFESTNNDEMNLDFTVPSFIDTSMLGNLDEQFAMTMMDDGSLITPPISLSNDDQGFFSGNFDVDLLPELDSAFDPSQLIETSSDSDNNFSTGTSLASHSESALLEALIPPGAHWQKAGLPADFLPSYGSKLSQNAIRPRIHRTTSSTPSQSSSKGHAKRHGQDTTMSDGGAQQALKRPSPESYSSGSDSDSPCRCIERALRLLEKLPKLSSSSSTSTSSGGSSSPDPMEVNFEGVVGTSLSSTSTSSTTASRSRTANPPGSMTFVTAGALFLSHFSKYLAVFSSVSSCQACLRKSSFAMILLMLAQRLTSRIKLLLRQHSPMRQNKDTALVSNGKYTLNLGDHPVEYEDMTPLLSTLLAGKICRLAACISKLKAICVSARWSAYAKGFEALETPLRERMAELESMM
ncbi:hypothetical protein GGR54DRAFT_358513 [Hypoxylon sp. NC1633]|nr:hypothetical protein GGR54DRAFT_358513 [Hypoxylon sp. NC1633]